MRRVLKILTQDTGATDVMRLLVCNFNVRSKLIYLIVDDVNLILEILRRMNKTKYCSFNVVTPSSTKEMLLVN